MNLKPFPHETKNNLFDTKLWDKIENYWPGKNTFSTYADGHNRKKKDSGRFGFYIIGYASKSSLSKLNKVERIFWKNFANNKLKEEIINSFYHYLPWIRNRYKNNINKLSLQTFAVLVYANKTLNIKIHTENPANLFSGLIYYNNGMHEMSGTSIYQHKQNNFHDPGVRFLERDDFVKVKTIPYKSNTMFSFLKTDNSFHGVEKINLTKKQDRLSINWHVRLTNECIREIYGIKDYKNFARSDGAHIIKIMTELKQQRQLKLDFSKPSKFEQSLILKSFDSL